MDPKVREIKEKYEQLDNKMDFVHMMASKTGRTFLSVKNHHFGGKWNIPEKFHDLYIKELDKVLKFQV